VHGIGRGGHEIKMFVEAPGPRPSRNSVHVAYLFGHTNYSAIRTISLNRKPSAAANWFAISMLTLTLPNSIELIYVLWTSAFSAKSS
jgi:hypothetical protein